MLPTARIFLATPFRLVKYLFPGVLAVVGASVFVFRISNRKETIPVDHSAWIARSRDGNPLFYNGK
jgi:hypothetical protein